MNPNKIQETIVEVIIGEVARVGYQGGRGYNQDNTTFYKCGRNDHFLGITMKKKDNQVVDFIGIKYMIHLVTPK